LTYNPQANRLYVHVFAWPFVHLHLDGFAGKVAYAQLLNDASEIKFTDPSRDKVPDPSSMSEELAKRSILLQLPVQKPPVTVPVIELFLKK
jgi:alpha-L-fucosidase